VENGPVFRALPLFNTSPAFWKSNGPDSDQACDFHVAAIEDYDTNGFFRNSWGLDWGNNGCGYLPFNNWNVGVQSWLSLMNHFSLFPLRPLQTFPFMCSH